MPLVARWAHSQRTDESQSDGEECVAAVQIYKEMKKPTARYRQDNTRMASGRTFHFWHDSLWQESTWSHDLPLGISVIFVSIVFWAQRHQLRTQCWKHRDDCYHLVKFWGLSGHSMHVRYAPSFLRLVGTSFKRVPVDCSSLRQFTLCMPSSPILSNSGHFVTSSTVSCAIWFESLLLYRIYHSNTKSGWVCPYLRSQSLLVCIFLIPKRWCGVGTRTARFLDLDWNVLG